MMCCGKEMLFESSYMNGEDGTCFTCLECGYFVSKISGQLDEEDLEAKREQEDWTNELNGLTTGGIK